MSKTFLLIAGYPDFLVNFRSLLLRVLLSQGLEVHVAAPDLPAGSVIRQQLVSLGVHVHEVTLKRKGMNPFADLNTVYSLWQLMRRVRPDNVQGYTIKPVIYGSLAAWLAGVPGRFALITGLGCAFQGDSGQRSWLRQVVHW